MSHSNDSRFSWRFAVLVLGLAASGAVRGTAQQKDQIRTAQELIQVFYPELNNSRNEMLVFWSDPFDKAWTTSGFLREFGLDVAETKTGLLTTETKDAIGSGLLNTFCEFEADGSLHAMTMRGRANHYREHADMRALVDQHVEWSSEQVMDAMREQGALFGPDRKDAFTKTLPRMSSLAMALAGIARIVSVEFITRLKDFADTTYAQLEWSVELEVLLGPDRAKSVRYVAAFEPFGGKIIAIHSKPAQPAVFAR
jgi:hypothetical protein